MRLTRPAVRIRRDESGQVVFIWFLALLPAAIAIILLVLVIGSLYLVRTNAYHAGQLAVDGAVQVYNGTTPPNIGQATASMFSTWRNDIGFVKYYGLSDGAVMPGNTACNGQSFPNVAFQLTATAQVQFPGNVINVPVCAVAEGGKI
jgi:hypothetical protein